MRIRNHIAVLFLCLVLTLLSFPAHGERTLDPAGMPPERIELTDAQWQPGKVGGILTCGRTSHNPGLTIGPPGRAWDFSAFETISVPVRNSGSRRIRAVLRIAGPPSDARKSHTREAAAWLKPDEQAVLSIRLHPTPWRVEGQVEVVGMRAAPGMYLRVDPADVRSLSVSTGRGGGKLTLGAIRLSGKVPAIRAREFFPFVDRFGQYRHDDWPGKVTRDAELKRRAEAERRDLAARAGPKDWNQYGGWLKGPQLEATGAFRVEKLDGQWWLVDPDGRLFWSQGIDCVHWYAAATPITDRKRYFAWLPGAGDPAAEFYGTGSWAPRGYYHGKGQYRTFNFQGANLLRKYGEDWLATAIGQAHRRLRSWGMNTIGNWSAEAVYLAEGRRTPYCTAVHFKAPPIEASTGYWGKFPDVFDPAFAAGLRKALAAKTARTAEDPWCIGYFVGNELSWTDPAKLVGSVLESPKSQPARKQLLADLRKRYDTIEKLNAAWKTEYGSWEAMAEDDGKLTRGQLRAAGGDFRRFYDKLVRRYFAICRDEVRRAAPKRLYLGCRFSWAPERVVRAAAEACDVVSFNYYREHLAGIRLPEGVDKPVISGEYHFGALDRGMFHTGLISADSQKDRARKFTRYVRSALENPIIVGAHWFQYGDQALTGRGDGENYQIGFVDVTDTPYPEMVAAARVLGAELYRIRRAAAGGGQE